MRVRVWLLVDISGQRISSCRQRKRERERERERKRDILIL